MALSCQLPSWSLFDIAVNLTDAMYDGVYHGHACHDEDRRAVVQRAIDVGVRGMLVCAGSVVEAEQAIALCAQYSSPHMHCLSTVGCHPTRAGELDSDADAYLARMDELLTRHSVAHGGCVAAIGEFGLDYDRLSFCSAEVQQRGFARQLQLAQRHQLPLYLHNRNTGDDFYDMLARYVPPPSASSVLRGVLHSFTGTAAELRRALDAGLLIGVNGCSLKTTANLDVVRQIPLDRLVLETDAPWCELRNTHASRALLTTSVATVSTTATAVTAKDTAATATVAAAASSTAGARATGRVLSDVLLAPYAARVKTRHAHTHMVKSRNEPCQLVQILDVVYALRRDEVASVEQLAAVVADNTRRLFPFRAGNGGGVA